MVSNIQKPNGDHVEIRCIKCKKLLGKPCADAHGIEIKCKRCGTLNTFLEKSEHQIVITNTSGVILFANDAVVQATKYTIEEIIGSTPALWGNQMPKAFYENMWQQILEEKRTFVDTITNRRKTGEQYDVRLRVSPILNAMGDVEFFVAIETNL